MLIKELYSIPELKAAIRKAREIRANIRFGMSEMTDVRISKIEANQVVLVDTQGASRVITLFQRDKP